MLQLFSNISPISLKTVHFEIVVNFKPGLEKIENNVCKKQSSHRNSVSTYKKKYWPVFQSPALSDINISQTKSVKPVKHIKALRDW